MKVFNMKRKLLILVSLSLMLACLFSSLPVYGASEQEEPLRLIPGGMTFGVQLQTKGVLVIGLSSVVSGGQESSPAAEADIKIGDIIYEVNGSEVNTVDRVTDAVNGLKGDHVEFSLLRKGKKLTKTVFPVLSDDDNTYKTGIVIRDNTAGIGTVTFIDGESGFFAGLGHGICDCDTGVLMPLLKGRVCDVTVTGIKKGMQGTPGEIKGYFSAKRTGALISNTPVGVYGIFDSMPGDLMEPVQVSDKNEIKQGKAYIYTTVDGTVPDKYEISIVRIANKNGESKNFVIEVTDDRLLEKTSGIVQGM